MLNKMIESSHLFLSVQKAQNYPDHIIVRIQKFKTRLNSKKTTEFYSNRNKKK